MPKHVLFFWSYQIYFLHSSLLVFSFPTKPNCFFNNSENHRKSSLRTRLEKTFKNISKTRENWKSLVFFKTLVNSKTSAKTNRILTFLLLLKIHLEKSDFIFVARLRWEGCAPKRVSHFCGGFKIFMSKVELPCGLSGAAPRFFALRKKVLVAPAPLTKLTKHIVRLRCRCSCEMCSTSAVPLLVIHETSVKSS